MISQKEDRANYLGRAVLLVLFFLFISAFSGKPVNKTKPTVPYESLSDLHSGPVKGIIAAAVQLPAFQKNRVSSHDKLSFHLFSKIFKISSDNRKIAQQFIFLQQAEILIQPISYCRFYYHFFSADSDELPILS